MNSRQVGFLIIGISALVGYITYSFNLALTEIVSTSCEHGTSCPMWGTITFQTNVSLSIMTGIILVGMYIIFFVKDKKPEQIKIEVSKKSYEEVMKELDEEGKKVLEAIIEDKGTIFQSDLSEKTNMNKVKVTRVLDKLEGKGIIERKRRGMTNVVILKNK
ncbi:MAG: MarR family transcriptional regulator [Candidatus Nanoarchaeia archaeon]|nr:MarR family transcriptional regulator [Candidatus Nanoarchaeia archaeon]